MTMSVRVRSSGAALAWLVHALTASGAVIAFLALIAVERGGWREALLWLLVALLIDGIDGPLARWLEVGTHTPRIDGTLLDLVVDFLTFVFVPSLLIYRMEVVPGWFALPAVALIQLSSLYHYARADLKTSDNYFVGFPALWNVVAFYLLVLHAPPWLGAAVVCVCAAATFAPVLFVHPVRVRAFRPWIPIVAVLWSISSIALLWPGWDAAATHVLLAGSLGAAAVLVAFGLLRSFSSAQREGQTA